MKTQENETKKRINKVLLWILGAIFAPIIGVIVTSILSKIDILELVRIIVKFLFQAEIGLLILILILFKIVHSLYQKNKSLSNFQNELSDTNIKELLSDNKRFMKINDELRESANKLIDRYKNIKDEIKEEIKADLDRVQAELKAKIHKESNKKIELNLQHIFILQKLGEQSNLLLEQEDLFRYYKRNFPEASRMNFNIAINHLRKLNTISLVESFDEDDLYTITEFGLECMGAIEAKKAK